MPQRSLSYCAQDDLAANDLIGPYNESLVRLAFISESDLSGLDLIRDLGSSARDGVPCPPRGTPTASWIRDALALASQGTGYVFTLRVPGRDLVGATALRSISPRRNSAVLSYWIAPGFRGLGFGAQGVGLTLLWGFTALRLSKIEAFVLPENIASRRVLARSGFRFMQEISTAGGPALAFEVDGRTWKEIYENSRHADAEL